MPFFKPTPVSLAACAFSFQSLELCSSGHGRQLDKAFCVKLILGCVPMNLVFILVGPDSNRYNIIRQY
ncbi:hypothetical protein MGG_16798 [Pyricularia oryzae 70-15]|uniref:Uncharacterized protein n=3 Tax=Pyricularia oryzae TaxID=318829 RepID=G4N1S4_PYRO7|nr:uncharacterized protein MGG_16798 [Pyricularia oryzae 70-15]EHA52439.1 hypothetical protein MGG_16798 [Pyricularia oryzae 70-15]ELQ39211.1 hypothetical protein OOU_Y34scaffold00511g1 [Pyricularia oryzae Y34]